MILGFDSVSLTIYYKTVFFMKFYLSQLRSVAWILRSFYHKGKNTLGGLIDYY